MSSEDVLETKWLRQYWHNSYMLAGQFVACIVVGSLMNYSVAKCDLPPTVVDLASSSVGWHNAAPLHHTRSSWCCISTTSEHTRPRSAWCGKAEGRAAATECQARSASDNCRCRTTQHVSDTQLSQLGFFKHGCRKTKRDTVQYMEKNKHAVGQTYNNTTKSLMIMFLRTTPLNEKGGIVERFCGDLRIA